VQKQIVVTVGASQRASEAKILVKIQASAQSEVREVTVEAVAQVVHETTAIVVVIVMIAASAPRAQIVRLEPSEHPAKTYHQSTRPP
jgi:hypothetical protein